MKEDIKQYIIDTNEMVGEYTENKKKEWKKVVRAYKRKVLLSRIRNEKRIDYLIHSIKCSNELHRMSLINYQTLVEFGEHCLSTHSKEDYSMYDAYKDYCVLINDASNKLAYDILKSKFNREAFTYSIDSETRLEEIEEKSKEVKNYVLQSISKDKVKKLVK